MNIKSLLEQKRTKVILTFLYVFIALLLLLLTLMHKIAIGTFVANCLLGFGVLLWQIVRSKGATH